MQYFRDRKDCRVWLFLAKRGQRCVGLRARLGICLSTTAFQYPCRCDLAYMPLERGIGRFEYGSAIQKSGSNGQNNKKKKPRVDINQVELKVGECHAYSRCEIAQPIYLRYDNSHMEYHVSDVIKSN